MSCNELRLMANEILRQIYVGPFDSEERIDQLSILKMYAEAAIKQITKEAEKNRKITVE